MRLFCCFVEIAITVSRHGQHLLKKKRIWYIFRFKALDKSKLRKFLKLLKDFGALKERKGIFSKRKLNWA